MRFLLIYFMLLVLVSCADDGVFTNPDEDIPPYVEAQVYLNDSIYPKSKLIDANNMKVALVWHIFSHIERYEIIDIDNVVSGKDTFNVDIKESFPDIDSLIFNATFGNIWLYNDELKSGRLSLLDIYPQRIWEAINVYLDLQRKRDSYEDKLLKVSELRDSLVDVVFNISNDSVFYQEEFFFDTTGLSFKMYAFRNGVLNRNIWQIFTGVRGLLPKLEYKLIENDLGTQFILKNTLVKAHPLQGQEDVFLNNLKQFVNFAYIANNFADSINYIINEEGLKEYKFKPIDENGKKKNWVMGMSPFEHLMFLRGENDRQNLINEAISHPAFNLLNHEGTVVTSADELQRGINYIRCEKRNPYQCTFELLEQNFEVKMGDRWRDLQGDWDVSIKVDKLDSIFDENDDKFVGTYVTIGGSDTVQVNRVNNQLWMWYNRAFSESVILPNLGYLKVFKDSLNQLVFDYFDELVGIYSNVDNDISLSFTHKGLNYLKFLKVSDTVNHLVYDNINRLASYSKNENGKLIKGASLYSSRNGDKLDVIPIDGETIRVQSVDVGIYGEEEVFLNMFSSQHVNLWYYPSFDLQLESFYLADSMFHYKIKPTGVMDEFYWYNVDYVPVAAEYYTGEKPIKYRNIVLDASGDSSVSLDSWKGCNTKSKIFTSNNINVTKTNDDKAYLENDEDFMIFQITGLSSSNYSLDLEMCVFHDKQERLGIKGGTHLDSLKTLQGEFLYPKVEDLSERIVRVNPVVISADTFYIEVRYFPTDSIGNKVGFSGLTVKSGEVSSQN